MKLDIASCKAVDTSKIDAEYRAGYTGVLVTGTAGKETLTAFVHQSQKLDCKTLKPKAKISASVDHACCDGDPNVPCLVGARKIFSNVKVSR